jgi:hypothetical protein
MQVSKPSSNLVRLVIPFKTSPAERRSLIARMRCLVAISCGVAVPGR